MAKNNIFFDYDNFVSEIQNQIMKIQFRYDECQSKIVTDYESGLLSKEDFEVLHNCRMDMFFDSYSSKYVLNSEEVEYLKEYADLDNEGKVLASIIKPIFIRKNEHYKDVFKSVSTFAYYDSFDITDRKRVFSDIYVDFYTKEYNSISEEINRIRSVYGKDNPNSSKYRELLTRLENVNKALKYGKEISSLSEDSLNKLIASFYRVKQSYYQWFLNMQLREEYQKGVIFDEHYSEVLNLQRNIQTSISDRLQYQKDTSNALNISKCLSKFLEEFIDFDLEQFDNLEKKGFLGFAKNTENNLDILFKVFTELKKLFGVNFYLDSNFSCEEDIADKERFIFDKYFKINYGNITYVSIEDFVKRFRRCVTAYYKRALAGYDKIIQNYKTTVLEQDLTIKNMSESSVVQARLIEKIYYGFNGSNSVILNGFTSSESEAMFITLKEYISNGFVFTDEEKTKGKV